MTKEYSRQHLDLAARLKLPPDDPMVFITLENLRLGDKIYELSTQFETWTEAILSHGKLAARQNQLIVDQGEGYQKTTKSYENLSSAIFQFKQETSEYSKGLTKLIDSTQILNETSKSITPGLEKTEKSIESLNSLSMSESRKTRDFIEDLNKLSATQSKKTKDSIETLSKLSATNLDNQKAILSKLEHVNTGVSNLARNWNYREIAAIILITTLFTAGGMLLGRYQGYQDGVYDGGSIAEDRQAQNWFGGRGNMEFWSKVRTINADQVEACLENNQSQCSIELP